MSLSNRLARHTPHSSPRVLDMTHSHLTVMAASYALVALAPLADARQLHPITGLVPTPSGLQLLPDSSISDVAVRGTTLYACGGFQQVGRYTGPAAVIDAASGVVQSPWPFVHGIVFCIVDDGAGGWFVGGDLSDVDGQVRRGVARVMANGTLAAFAPAINGGSVQALARYGSTLYAGGTFNDIGGYVRNHLAAFDVNTGNLLTWNPNVGVSWSSSQVVRALAVDATRVYVGGSFLQMLGGQQRLNLGAVSATTGAAVAWDPRPNGDVWALEVASQNLFVGGWFNAASTQPRSALALYETTALGLQPFSPAIAGGVHAMTVSGTTLYTVGQISSVGGSPRLGGAAFNITSAVQLGWDPQLTSASSFGIGWGVVAVGSDVFVLGDFDKSAGQRRIGLAVLDPVTGQPRTRTLDLTGDAAHAHALAASGTNIAVGGEFRLVGGVHRTGAAAWNLTDGSLLPWAPQIAGYLNPDGGGALAIEILHSHVFLAGQFEQVNGVACRHIASVDATTGALDTGFLVPGNLHPTSDFINQLAVGGGRLFAAGYFHLASGAMINLAALDPISGSPLPAWSSAASYVSDLEPSENGSVLYVSGAFSGLGIPAVPIEHLAALNAANGMVLTNWNPLINNTVADVQRAGPSLFACGSFTSVKNSPVQYAAKFDAGTAALQPWSISFSVAGSGGPSHIALRGQALFLARGNFFFINGLYRNGIAAVNSSDGSVYDWDPAPDRAAGGVRVVGNYLVVLGDFERISGVILPRVAIYRFKSGP